MANNTKATQRRCARQEKPRQAARENAPEKVVDPELRELIGNLNWFFRVLRSAVDSEGGRLLADRLGLLAGAACIIDGLTLDSAGWAALLGLKNARSFSKMKIRKRFRSHKPGQTLMFTAADLLDATKRGSRERDEAVRVSGNSDAEPAG